MKLLGGERVFFENAVGFGGMPGEALEAVKNDGITKSMLETSNTIKVRVFTNNCYLL